MHQMHASMHAFRNSACVVQHAAERESENFANRKANRFDFKRLPPRHAKTLQGRAEAELELELRSISLPRSTMLVNLEINKLNNPQLPRAAAAAYRSRLLARRASERPNASPPRPHARPVARKASINLEPQSQMRMAVQCSSPERGVLAYEPAHTKKQQTGCNLSCQ